MNRNSTSQFVLVASWLLVASAIVVTLIGVGLRLAPLDAADPQPVESPQSVDAETPAITNGSSNVETAVEKNAAAQRGYTWLRTRPYLPADFDQETFDQLWTTWPESERAVAASATAHERRQLTLQKYGLIDHQDADGNGPGIGYVPLAPQPPEPTSQDDDHAAEAAKIRDSESSGIKPLPMTWVMNCFACHAGKVAGEALPGAPNTHTALHSLTADVRTVKLQQGKVLSHLDLGSLQIPLGGSNGTTNAVVFGVALGARRDIDMNVDLSVPEPVLDHHDMDPPAWWTTRKKKRIYADGFAARSHRALLQFVMLPINDGPQLRKWEEDYRDVLAYIESVPVPKYPFAIDTSLAAQGRELFVNNCSRCHGTYGENVTYPNKIVPLDEIGTDPVRLHALTPQRRADMSKSWMGGYGELDYLTDPKGYLAPPLDGVWASAPYFHNGSVPTLWHVLNADQRPAVWQRNDNGYDTQRVGIQVEERARLPRNIRTAAERRTWFDTTQHGKSATGHEYPLQLSPDERTAVLEYLKTL